MPEASVVYYPSFFNPTIADTLFNTLLKETPWQQDQITVYGKTHPQPRLTALYADNDTTYTYANITMQPNPFTKALLQIKHEIERITTTAFTSCLLNLYRDGQDSNGWHSDNEKELGVDPIIISVNLGQERIFHFKHKKNTAWRQKIRLEHGSILITKGTTQENWLHQLPKVKKSIGPRINLTFRIINPT